jgi:two-component system response regulator YesN
MKNENNLSISEISDLLGFNNQHYFSRVFKQYCGMSPSEFRYS